MVLPEGFLSTLHKETYNNNNNNRLCLERHKTQHRNWVVKGTDKFEMAIGSVKAHQARNKVFDLKLTSLQTKPSQLTYSRGLENLTSCTTSLDMVQVSRLGLLEIGV